MSAPGARGRRLVTAAIRCYPAGWRRRHAAEAAELAALLISDGTPAVLIAWSYLRGAARAWLAPRPGRPVSAVGAALVAAVCLLGFSAALVAQTGPARAASATPNRPSSAPAARQAPAGGRSWSPRPPAPCAVRQSGHAPGGVPAPGHWSPIGWEAARASAC